jgi:hypothetical protein
MILDIDLRAGRCVPFIVQKAVLAALTHMFTLLELISVAHLRGCDNCSFPDYLCQFTMVGYVA